MNKQTSIALLGATGKAGKYILSELLNNGYAVKALVRQPQQHTITHPSLTIVEGDAINANSIDRLLNGCVAVISAIGPRKDEPLISSLSTGHIISAMHRFGIYRYIVLAGLNVDVPGDNKSPANKIKSEWMRQNFPEAVADRQKAYDMLADSDTNWTMVRLPWIEQTNERQQLVINFHDCPGEKISTADLADFVVRQITDAAYYKRAPFVASI